MSGRMAMRTTSTEIKKVGRHEGGKRKPPVEFGRLTGNLRFPLDKTYHGCPRNNPKFSFSTWGEGGGHGFIESDRLPRLVVPPQNMFCM